MESTTICSPWRELQSCRSLYPPDSVEFCPIAPYQDVFLVGTYHLTQSQDGDSAPKTGLDKRKGAIDMYHLNRTEERIELMRSFDTAAILDIKWNHCKVQDKILFAVVNAIGQLIVYELFCKSADNLLDLDIIKLTSHQLDQGEASEVLGLSLDWSSRNHTSDGNSRSGVPDDVRSQTKGHLVVSDSRGFVHLFELAEGGLILESSWKGHGFEAWIAAFNYAEPTTFYSGGDDCLMKVYDSRQSRPMRIVKEHDAGVTSIQYNTFTTALHTLATGSYDEHVYIWDDRNFKSYGTKVHLEGGVWRIKHQSEGSILTATMYNGFHYVDWRVERGDNSRDGNEIRQGEEIGGKRDEVKTGAANVGDTINNRDSVHASTMKNIENALRDSTLNPKSSKIDVKDTPTNEEDNVKVLHYKGHGSIAYGVDSCYLDQKYIVTCSFYDHLIHLSVLDK
uniref:methylated diphthine methylhydrolase n=1 Tax=Cacopsylla melanoneura TaxID=428564 RepID=A0A8D9AKT3_9HEMI